MTLDKAPLNRRIRIVRINGGIGVRQRLHQMGIFEGSCIRVRRRSRFGGPLLIEYGPCSVAVGRGMAEQIDVEEPDEESDEHVSS